MFPKNSIVFPVEDARERRKTQNRMAKRKSRQRLATGSQSQPKVGESCEELDLLSLPVHTQRETVNVFNSDTPAQEMGMGFCQNVHYIQQQSGYNQSNKSGELTYCFSRSQSDGLLYEMDMVMSAASNNWVFGGRSNEEAFPPQDYDLAIEGVDSPASNIFTQRPHWMGLSDIGREFNEEDAALPFEQGSYSRRCSNNPPLHEALSQGHCQVVRVLMVYGAGVDTEDQNSRTALHHAAMNGHNSIVKILIEQDANVHLMDGMGCTALYYAAKGGYADVVAKLAQSGALID